MNNPGYGFHLLVISLLWLLPVFAEADDAIFGIPEAKAVEFKPERHIDPMELLPIEVNGQWGYADRAGNIVIAPRYEWVDYFYGPIYYSKNRGNSLYAWAARYRSHGQMGVLAFRELRSRSQTHMKGEVLEIGRASGVSPDRYHNNFVVLGRWVNDQRRYHVTRELEFGSVNITYQAALRMNDGLAAVQDGELCGYINKRGKVEVPLMFAEARSFHDNLAAVRQPATRGGGWGFIGSTGKFVFIDQANKIEELRSYHEGLAAVKVRGKWGFMDKRQHFRIETIYDEVRDFADGRAAVRRGDEWGYINTTGKEIAWGFDGAWNFDITSRSGLEGNESKALSTALGLVKQGDAYGYVNRTGKLALQPRYQNALPFFRGVARVKCGNSFAYINQDGRPVWDPRRVSRYGIRGLQVADVQGPRWSGLPGTDGTHGEPYPFEYDVEDHLPLAEPTEPDPEERPVPEQRVEEPKRRGAGR